MTRTSQCRGLKQPGMCFLTLLHRNQMSVLDRTTWRSSIHDTKTHDTWDSCSPKHSPKSLFALPRFSFTSTMNISSNGHSFLFWPHFMLETLITSIHRPPVTHALAVWFNLVLPEIHQSLVQIKPVQNLMSSSLPSNRDSQNLSGFCSHTLFLVAFQQLDHCKHEAFHSDDVNGVRPQPSLYTCQQMVFHQHTSGQLSSVFTGEKCQCRESFLWKELKNEMQWSRKFDIVRRNRERKTSIQPLSHIPSYVKQ